MIYRRQDGSFYRTLADGSSQWIVQRTESWVSLSPEGTHLLVVDGYNQYILDIATGQQAQLMPQGKLASCGFWWIRNNQTWLLGDMLGEDGPDPGYSCYGGYPAIIRRDGSLFYRIETEVAGISYSVASPSGDRIAYERGGQPVIYTIGQGSVVFDPAKYGLRLAPGARIADPSWSPSGRFLAWTVFFYDTAQVEPKPVSGIAIFDLQERTARYLTPYELSFWEADRPMIRWSGDEKFISVWGYDRLVRDFSTRVLSLDGSLVRVIIENSLDWSPVGHWLGYDNYPAEEPCHLVIELPDGADQHRFCGEWDFIWSPSGDALVYADSETAAFWLVQVPGWTPQRIALPEDAELWYWRP